MVAFEGIGVTVVASGIEDSDSTVDRRCDVGWGEAAALVNSNGFG